jgi:hypothetical protein
MDEEGPLQLNREALYTAIRSVSPTGAQAFGDALNLSGSHFTANIYNEVDQTLLGRVGLKLGVDGDKIFAVSKKWIPLKRLPGPGTALGFLLNSKSAIPKAIWVDSSTPCVKEHGARTLPATNHLSITAVTRVLLQG